jgi:hypothetical protein
MAAHTQTRDAGLWAGFTLDFDLKKKFHAGADVQSRWNENITEARSNFIQPWISKDWTDDFSTLFSYRIAARRTLDNIYEGRDRANLDLKYKIKLRDIKIQYRIRLQRELGIFDTERAVNAQSAHRHRIKFGYGINKKFDVSVLGESFFSADKNQEQTLTDLRFKTSVKYKVKKRNYFSVGYLIQKEYNAVNPVMDFNVVIGYVLVVK